MRIKAIELAWFRGAAEVTSLPLESKSMVVYGENGSGKSSFVDAVEYVLQGGRIGHLAHEYSGRNQEKGILNTHTPEEGGTEIRITFQDGSELKREIKRSGYSIIPKTSSVAMAAWDYRRTVLRQDEVTRFIGETKGEKYSKLLPLLGLHHLEVAAENLRKLTKSVEEQAKINVIKAGFTSVKRNWEATFGADTYEQIFQRVENLHAKYCADKVVTTDPLSRCKELGVVLEGQFARFADDHKRYFFLQRAAELNLNDQVGEVRSLSLKLADAVEPLISEKLGVLQSADVFVERLEEEGDIICPACGQTISVNNFQTHVKAEKKRLKETIETFDSRKTAIGRLVDTIKSLKSSLDDPALKAWRDEMAKGALARNFSYLDAFNPEALRTVICEEDMKGIEGMLLPLIDEAASSSKNAPPDVQELTTDKKTIEVAKAVIEMKTQSLVVKRVQELIDFVKSIEQGVREEIKIRSQNVIDEISDDIQRMWAILHPDNVILGVKFYLPEDTDKAIDIGLKFHNIEQDSPRLTLSEGYKNSLGLCIFLAMAKKDEDKDQPLFLDDVIISLDRNHRGMVVELLEKEFSGWQVVILTHDREWYTELRQRLDERNWNFRALRPYENPQIGIRWSTKGSTFDDARVLLESAPDAAGNTVRKIMDIELAVLAERVKLKLPYLHREKNDHRTSHDFLSRFISDGEKCLKKKGEKSYEPYIEALEAFREADKLLLSWGNRASHTFDVVRVEAEKLIDVCERALDLLKCSGCSKHIYRCEDGSAKLVQCTCSNLQWRYDKA